ncbi:MAG: ion channel [Methanotrichaceae archaeon]|nr:ion channel [Methanotrichaceae archaeon]
MARVQDVIEPVARGQKIRLAIPLTGPFSRALSSVSVWVSNHRPHVLFLSLILLIAVYPFSENTDIGGLILVTLFTVVLLAAIYEVSYKNRYTVIGIILAVPSFVATWSEAFVPSRGTLIAQIVTLTIFLIYTLTLILKQVISSRKVQAGEIFNAISVYIMIGVCFGMLYHLIEILAPHSFQLSSPEVHFSEVTYFSFAALTSGFGEVAALSTLARSLVTLESILGMIYVAVLIGLLIRAFRAKAPVKQSEISAIVKEKSECGAILKQSLFRGKGKVTLFVLVALGAAMLAGGLNFGTSKLMVDLHIPFYLDTWATSLAVMLGNFWIGALAGIIYNLIMAFTYWGHSYWVWMFSSILVAAVTWFFCKSNWIDILKPFKIVAAGITTGVLNTILSFIIIKAAHFPEYEGTLVIYRLFMERTHNQAISSWFELVSMETVDKTIAILLAAAIGYLIYDSFKRRVTERPYNLT